MNKSAIVIGGAESVWRELDALSLPDADIIAINDAGCHYPGKLAMWITLHPQKMPTWKQQRAAKGFDMAMLTVGHVSPGELPKFTDEGSDCWRGKGKASGSSGLFACQIALDKGYDKIILCGVPMNGDKNLFRGKAWADFVGYRQTWLDKLHLIEEKVVSQGGWTAELLGTYENPRPRKRRAIVLGGAPSVWSDFDMLEDIHATSDIIACNDAGWNYPDKLKYWVSLHPDCFKAWNWLEKRKAAGYDMDLKTVGFTRDFKPVPGVDELRSAWGSSDGKASGSTGLFAVEIAIAKGYDEIILCGCPLEYVSNMFNGHDWHDFGIYRQAWIDKFDKLKGKVYSQIGWTKSLLGSWI